MPHLDQRCLVRERSCSSCSRGGVLVNIVGFASHICCSGGACVHNDRCVQLTPKSTSAIPLANKQTTGKEKPNIPVANSSIPESVESFLQTSVLKVFNQCAIFAPSDAVGAGNLLQPRLQLTLTSLPSALYDVLTVRILTTYTECHSTIYFKLKRLLNAKCSSVSDRIAL